MTLVSLWGDDTTCFEISVLGGISLLCPMAFVASIIIGGDDGPNLTSIRSFDTIFCIGLIAAAFMLQPHAYAALSNHSGQTTPLFLRARAFTECGVDALLIGWSLMTGDHLALSNTEAVGLLVLGIGVWWYQLEYAKVRRDRRQVEVFRASGCFHEGDIHGLRALQQATGVRDGALPWLVLYAVSKGDIKAWQWACPPTTLDFSWKTMVGSSFGGEPRQDTTGEERAREVSLDTRALNPNPSSS